MDRDLKHQKYFLNADFLVSFALLCHCAKIFNMLLGRKEGKMDGREGGREGGRKEGRKSGGKYFKIYYQCIIPEW